MTTATLPIDPLALLRDLSAAQLRQRLAELDAETRAVRVLLRAALARERSGRRASAPATPEGVCHD